MSVQYSITNKAMEENYMKVEAVLRFINKKWLAIPQYKIGEETNHFFKCEEIKTKIGAPMFRIMECEVVQYEVHNPINI